MKVELQIDMRTEDQAVGRSAEMEHSRFLPFFNMLPLEY